LSGSFLLAWPAIVPELVAGNIEFIIPDNAIKS